MTRLRSRASSSTPLAGNSKSSPDPAVAVSDAKSLDFEPLFVGQQHRALDDIPQLADVARPPVGLERGIRRRARPLHAFAELAVEAVDEIFDEQRHILRMRAQRRDGNRQDVEPVVQVAAEPPFRHFLLEVAIRRRDDPHVDPDIVRRRRRA